MRIGANFVIQRNGFKDVEQLTFILMDAFHLHIEHRRWVDFNPHPIMNQLRQAGFVRLFHFRKFSAENRVLREWNQVFQLFGVIHKAIANGFAQ